MAGARILIVEDEPDIALGLQHDLQHEGYDVEVVGDGESAVERAGRGSLDLILLDINLPRKDGFTVCREVRRSGSHTPIIVLTARAQDAEKVLGLELGADDYVTKPFSPTELRARIKSILRQRKEWLGDGERLDRELRTAADVQRRLFPQEQPPAATLDYAGFCQPALQVGGDYYDYFDLPDEQLGLMVADVSGKGASAALVMATLHGCIRAHAPQQGSRCEETVILANTLLHQSTEAARYATLFYAVYDRATRQLRYVNAGHPPAIVARNGAVHDLDSGCTPVGLLAVVRPETGRIQLEPGDRVVIFSDGVTEAMNRAGEEFGRVRLEALIVAAAARTAADLRDAILAGLRAHTDGCPQSDDVTFIAGVVR